MVKTSTLCKSFNKFDLSAQYSSGILTMVGSKVSKWYKFSSYGLMTEWTFSSALGLICTIISENQGLEKSRSISNLRKTSGSGNLFF